MPTKKSNSTHKSNGSEVTLYASRYYTTPLLSRLINAKDYYNMVLRVLYPLLLTVLTTMVISGFVSRRKRLRHNLSGANFLNVRQRRASSRNSAINGLVGDAPKLSKQSKFSAD
uniref:Uncharacterized protein n=1 Tax=Romanomermis culicivorax TaxID=13658 RepID=A0A915JZW1_ROMCU